MTRFDDHADGQPTIRPVPESWRADGIEADPGLLPVRAQPRNVCRVDTMNKPVSLSKC